MTNMAMTAAILQWLKSQGVRDVCLCPGGRNSPFVEHFTHRDEFQVHTSFDERSAGFFALGLAQKNGVPAVVITTSGTAVAEVLPSVMEAHYSDIPLIVISADRPRRLRGTGAPQAVEQVGLFGGYAEPTIDLEKEFIAPAWDRRHPLHINVCFDEPLIDEQPHFLSSLPEAPVRLPTINKWSRGRLNQVSPETFQSDFEKFIDGKVSPLLLVGTLTAAEVFYARALVEKWPGPVYCESPSGLRECSSERQLISGDRILVKAWKNKQIDAVVRLGGVPTARLWRTLESEEFPLFSVSSRPFPGLARGEFYHADSTSLALLEPVISKVKPAANSLFAEDRALQKKWHDLLMRFPRSEPALVSWISQQIPSGATVYLGNSLPIREWDLVAQREKPFHVLANRGANGIDGQLSTALAFLSPQQQLWVVLGDLTSLYDSNALWFWKSNPQPLKLVVINNKGGQIFSRMFKSKLFCNSHDLNFTAWAAQWNLPYQAVTEPSPLVDGSALIEISPDESQTTAFWKQYDSIWG